MKKIEATLPYILSLGCLAGCSSSGETRPDDSGSAEHGTDAGAEEVTLRIATYLASPDERAALQAVIDAYRTARPEVRIDVKPLLLSPPQTIAQLTGEMPIEGGWDVAIHTVTSVPGVLDVSLDLNSLPALTPFKSTYHPSVAASVEFDGFWAGMPLGIAGFNIAIYNQEALAELGFSSAPSSLDELVDLCQSYIDLDDATLPTPLGEASDEFGPLVVMTAFLPGDVTFGVPGSEEELVKKWRKSVRALEFFTQNDCAFLVEDDNGNGSHHDENFERTISGKNALGVGPVWGLGYFIAQGEIQRGNFDFGPLIGDEAGLIYTVELVTVNKDTPHTQEVSDFLEVVGDKRVQIDYLRARGGTPAALFADPAEIGDPALEAAYSAFQTADAENRAGPFPPYLLSLEKATGPLRGLFEGTGSADEVIEAYLCGEPPRHPTLEHYETSEDCLRAIRAIPDSEQ